MEKKRPTSITVIAILNFVFGGIGLLLICCLGVSGGILAAMVSNMPPNQPESEMLRGMWSAFTDNIPGVVPYFVLSLGSTLVLSGILVVSGFGLLKLRNSARMACLFYSVASIIITLISAVYQFTVYNPAMPKVQKEIERVQLEQMRRMPGGGNVQMQQNDPFGNNPIINIISTVVGTLIGLIYPIVVLWFMLLPATREAFEAGGMLVERPAAEDDYSDFERERGYDDGYG